MSRPGAPDYLRKPSEAPEHVYGVLAYDGKLNEWIIEGEPCVAEMAKRLFPGSSGRGRGIVRFPATSRLLGDLNWLMLRYPLRVDPACREEWREARSGAVRHAVERMEILRQPQEATPSPLRFRGELLPFQREGLAFLLHNRRTLLADEMGLGKTVQALAFLAETQAWPALLVVPPHLITNWCREIERFLALPEPAAQPSISPDPARSVHVIRGLSPYDLPQVPVYVIHYLLLRGWRRVLP
ncbi:MAG: SNF2-related protein, partial [Thermaerobacter sp.]|nr:SNF2-related protein [Thermaerobacter sp.]